jgi:hypothetical protein
MSDKTDLDEDTNNIKLLDKNDKEKVSKNCCFYIFECLFAVCFAFC